jgi:hypothetical protein
MFNRLYKKMKMHFIVKRLTFAGVLSPFSLWGKLNDFIIIIIIIILFTIADYA